MLKRKGKRTAKRRSARSKAKACRSCRGTKRKAKVRRKRKVAA